LQESNTDDKDLFGIIENYFCHIVA